MRPENDRRNHFMINLHESMGPDRDRTRDPWNCSQTRICSQTRYRLRYAARLVVAWFLPLDISRVMYMKIQAVKSLTVRFGENLVIGVIQGEF